MNECSTSDPALFRATGGAMVALPRVPRWQSWLWFPIKLLVGAVLMQSAGGAVVVTGWLQRFLQRAVYRSWWRSGRGRLGTFEEFVAEEPVLIGFRRLPNWVLAQERGVGFVTATDVGTLRRRRAEAVETGGDPGSVQASPLGESPEAVDEGQDGGPAAGTPAVRVVRAGILQRWFGSLAINVWLGIQTLTNVALLTMPGAVLWWVGWWGGWQNSFHKGYEQFMVGPLVSWFGILLFMAAMFYVPMAVARQAATGQWKSFWDGRTVWTLVRASWWQSAWVAGVFAVANLFVMGLKSWPQFWPQAMMSDLATRGLDPTEAFRQGLETVDWSNLTDAQAVHLLTLYYLGSAGVVLLVLLGLKRLLAWLYAGAVLRAVQRGTLGEDSLSDTEWRLLNTLGLLHVRGAPYRPFLVRWIAWAGTTVGRAVCRTCVFVGWFVFVAAIYVSEFLAHHPVVGWLNQPLVQLPWFRYVPPHLENPAPALIFAGFLVLVACVAVRIRRRALLRHEPPTSD